LKKEKEKKKKKKKEKTKEKKKEKKKKKKKKKKAPCCASVAKICCYIEHLQTLKQKCKKAIPLQSKYYKSFQTLKLFHL